MSGGTVPSAVALGLFDGVHLGHRAVLRAALRQKENGLIPAAFTFQAEMAQHKNTQGYLYPTEHKLLLLRQDCGMMRVEAPPFAQMCGMTGEDFVRQVLCGQMGARHICCGADFRFGRGAACDAADLQALGKQYGFTAEIVDAVQADGVTVSSSEIRSLLLAGEIGRANRLLGEPYTILTEVSRGAQLGRTIGFPTINQVFREGQLVPKFGVYASRTKTPDGWHTSLTNIGMKPTVRYDGAPLAETYIIDYQGELYGQTVQTQLHCFLREEQKFPSVEALTKQMAQDLDVCKHLSKSYHHSDT